MKLTGIRVDSDPSTKENSKELQALLLDSYTLHPDKRVSASHAHDATSSLGICVGLSTRDDLSTTIATVHYDSEISLRTELHVKVGGNRGEQELTSELTSVIKSWSMCRMKARRWRDKGKWPCLVLSIQKGKNHLTNTNFLVIPNACDKLNYPPVWLPN